MRSGWGVYTVNYRFASGILVQAEEARLINLLLVDRDVQVYQGLLTDLHNDPDIAAIQPCETAQEALERSLEGTFDAVLINAATLLEPQALSLTREVSRLHPGVRVLVFGLPSAKEQVLDYIEAGADAYLRGTQSVQAIGRCLRQMLRGEVSLCPDVAAGLLSRIAWLAGNRGTAMTNNGTPAALSPRQREVLALLQRGLSNAQIAVQLSIEVGTVKNHVHNVLTKLQTGSRQEAAKLAVGALGNGDPVD